MKSCVSKQRTLRQKTPKPTLKQPAQPRVAGCCPPETCCGHIFSASVWSRCPHNNPHPTNGHVPELTPSPRCRTLGTPWIYFLRIRPPGVLRPAPHLTPFHQRDTVSPDLGESFGDSPVLVRIGWGCRVAGGLALGGRFDQGTGDGTASGASVSSVDWWFPCSMEEQCDRGSPFSPLPFSRAAGAKPERNLAEGWALLDGRVVCNNAVGGSLPSLGRPYPPAVDSVLAMAIAAKAFG